MAISAMEAARIACHRSGWKLSNLQLHKILYIASLAYAGKFGSKDTLINDEYFQAWRYGPVLPSVYQSSYQYGSDAIENLPGEISTSEDSDEYKEIAYAVDKLKHVPVFSLVEFTHSPDGAWCNAYNSGYNMPILPEDICHEYKVRFAPR